MKQIELANKLNISRGMVSLIMSGQRQPSWRLAKDLAEATGTEPELWLDGTNTEKQNALGGA